MNLFLDLISPIPEFTVIDENKIIYSRSIIQFEGDKLSDNIIPAFISIEKALNLAKHVKSLIVTTGPASYTSLRVGIAFILGQQFIKNIKIASLTAEDLLRFNTYDNKDIKHGIYIVSAHNQRFICYQLQNLKYKYIKLENQNSESLKGIKNIDILYYNYEPLKNSDLKFEQKEYIINENIVKHFSSLNFSKSSLIKPIYISNNKNLN